MYGYDTTFFADNGPSGIGGIDSYTKLMLHFDGENNSTAFLDSSLSTKTITANGSAKISTAQSVFGGASGLFTAATSDFIDTPDNNDYSFGSNDFTIDFRIRFNSVAASQALINQTTDADNYFILFTDIAGPFLRFTVKDATVFTVSYSVSWTPATNTWYHITLVRTGSALRFFVDGTQVGVDGTAATMPNLTGNLTIAKDTTGNGFAYLDGYLDELRVSNGVARWTSNFTPPAQAYTT